jgi:branched-chain amino acid transport system permease protein
MSGIFSILAVSLNIACGYAGVLSLAQAAFYGIGAYAVGLLTTKLGWSFMPAFLLGGVLATCCGLVLAVPTLRLRGDYFLMATLGFGEIFSNVLVNWDRLTEGSRGLTSIPPATILGINFGSHLGFIGLLAVVLLFCILSAYLIKTSPLGQVFFAVAEDEAALATLGRNPFAYKILAMALSAFWAGLAGGLYATYLGFISPSLFSINESILIFTMVLFGGLRSIAGAVAGAFTLIVLPEIMRFIGFPTATAALVRQMFYGALLIGIMYLRPQGLLGSLRLR